jgi:hypothetical protein
MRDEDFAAFFTAFKLASILGVHEHDDGMRTAGDEELSSRR